MPLAVTNQAGVYKWLERMVTHHHPESRGGAGAPLHDPCAIAWLIRPDLFTTRACSAAMDLGPGPSRGRTLIDRWDRTGAPHNALLLETLDAPGFFALLGERLASLP